MTDWRFDEEVGGTFAMDADPGEREAIVVAVEEGEEPPDLTP